MVFQMMGQKLNNILSFLPIDLHSWKWNLITSGRLVFGMVDEEVEECKSCSCLGLQALVAETGTSCSIHGVKDVHVLFITTNHWKGLCCRKKKQHSISLVVQLFWCIVYFPGFSAVLKLIFPPKTYILKDERSWMKLIINLWQNFSAFGYEMFGSICSKESKVIKFHIHNENLIASKVQQNVLR